MLDVVGCNIASPLDIEVGVRPFDHSKTSIFAGVDHGVVDMCRIGNFERHEEIFNFIPIVNSDPVRHSLEVNVRWVREKCCWRSALKDRLEEAHLLRMWLEN